MEDTISRQALLDKFEPWLKVKDYNDGELNMLKAILYEIRFMRSAQPAFDARDTQYNLPIGTDCISRRAAFDALNHELRCGAVINQCGLEAAYEVIEDLPSAQPEIIRCKDCKYWVPGYITDNDDFIPPKCGKWQQMVGHSSDDYCSLAERREVTT